MTRLRARAALALTALGLHAAPLPAQDVRGPEVDSVRMVADAATGSDARVRIAYWMHVPASIERIPLTLLSPEPTFVQDLGVRAHPRVRVGELPPSSTPQRTGALLLTPSYQDEDVAVTIDYTVRGAVAEGGDRSRIVLPVLVVDWAPAEALPGTFRARVRLSEGSVPYEAFPTPESDWAADTTGFTDLELSVLPAYLSIRARKGSAPLFSVPRVADGAVVLLLLGLGVWGWRALASSRRRRAE